MQKESSKDVVTPKTTRKRRRRGLQFSSRRVLLRARMKRKQARSKGVDLEGTVRTLNFSAAVETVLENNAVDGQFLDIHQLQGPSVVPERAMAVVDGPTESLKIIIVRKSVPIQFSAVILLNRYSMMQVNFSLCK